MAKIDRLRPFEEWLDFWEEREILKEMMPPGVLEKLESWLEDDETFKDFMDRIMRSVRVRIALDPSYPWSPRERLGAWMIRTGARIAGQPWITVGDLEEGDE